MEYLKQRQNKITTERLREMKQQNQKICCITAYDAAFAKLFDTAGIDLILVGDSVANVFQGKPTTLSVTLNEMIYHTKIVKNAVQRALVLADMPFMSYQISTTDAIKNAGIMLKETQCDAIKIEGASNQILNATKCMNEIGIPVMGHIGLTPQSINKFGTYRTRGTNDEEANTILNDATKLEQAGAFALLLEKIPATLAQKITNSVNIPTIGIGAGPHCDGQILVCNDMLGINTEFNPRFVRQYATIANTINKAVTKYTEDIRNQTFPNDNESY